MNRFPSKSFSILTALIALGILVAVVMVCPVSAQDDYLGSIRLYVVEPESRWTDGLGNSYDFGFVDWALMEAIDIKVYDVWSSEFLWDSDITGYYDLESDNLAIVAVIFNADSVTTDAFPPYGHWFAAYYVDASAYASPEMPGIGDPSGGFTHNPFLELAGSSG